jgi:hypothetical protein
LTSTPPAAPAPPAAPTPPATPGDDDARLGGVAAAPPAPELRAERARDLLVAHVGTTRWGWRGLARRLEIEAIERSGAFDVVLQSFTEKRDTFWEQRPYDEGEPIDGPDRGPAPGEWEIALEAPGVFINEHRVMPVPHTQTVKSCEACLGKSDVLCSRCSGNGEHGCGSCSGTGRLVTLDAQDGTRSPGPCQLCGGVGRVGCVVCVGSGRVRCETCFGRRQVVHYQELRVHWATRTNSEQVEKMKLPGSLVGIAEGVVVLREEDARLEPGRGGPHGGGPYRGSGGRVSPEVDAAVNRLLSSHRLAPEQRLLRQRLVVRGVPVHEVRYRYRGEQRSFWIYGSDLRVHAPRFPASPLRVTGALGAAAALAAVLALVLAALKAHPAPPVRTVTGVGVILPGGPAGR